MIIGTRALYYSTASQLGLAARALGVPNLLVSLAVGFAGCAVLCHAVWSCSLKQQ